MSNPLSGAELDEMLKRWVAEGWLEAGQAARIRAGEAAHAAGGGVRPASGDDETTAPGGAPAPGGVPPPARNLAPAGIPAPDGAPGPAAGSPPGARASERAGFRGGGRPGRG